MRYHRSGRELFKQLHAARDATSYDFIVCKDESMYDVANKNGILY